MVIFEPLFQLVTPDQWATVATQLQNNELMDEIQVDTLFALWRRDGSTDYPVSFSAQENTVSEPGADGQSICLPCLTLDFGWHKLLIPCQSPNDLYPFTPDEAESSKVISLAHRRNIKQLVPDLQFSVLEPVLRSWLSHPERKRWMLVVSPLADLAPWTRPLHLQIQQLVERANGSYSALMKEMIN